MISQTAEYALRATVFLGNQQGVPRTTAQIAEAIDAPAGYLSKVMHSLARARVVDSTRGLGGGFVLARAVDEISILDVVNAVDALRRYPHCPLGKPAHASGLCPLHMRLERLMEDAETEFRQTSIGELLEDPNAHHVCSFPCISEAVLLEHVT